jgi:hypothetical protein
MEAWQKQYAKLVNNKWQTLGGQDDDHDLDEDELYLLKEKKINLCEGGYQQCPYCEVMMKFDPHDLHCKKCGWDGETDPQMNINLCVA